MKYNCLNILKMTEAQLKFTHDVSLREATAQELHEALGTAVMMTISENWSHSKHTRMHQRKAYYISAEYLIGRLVYSNLYNMGILEEMKQVFAEHGVDLAILEEVEDAALGNGGLGRLAACFLDSAASTNIPLSGYGLRYRFGLFKHKFDVGGRQHILLLDTQALALPGGVIGVQNTGNILCLILLSQGAQIILIVERVKVQLFLCLTLPQTQRTHIVCNIADHRHIIRHS